MDPGPSSEIRVILQPVKPPPTFYAQMSFARTSRNLTVRRVLHPGKARGSDLPPQSICFTVCHALLSVQALRWGALRSPYLVAIDARALSTQTGSPGMLSASGKFFPSATFWNMGNKSPGSSAASSPLSTCPGVRSAPAVFFRATESARLSLLRGLLQQNLPGRSPCQGLDRLSMHFLAREAGSASSVAYLGPGVCVRPRLPAHFSEALGAGRRGPNREALRGRGRPSLPRAAGGRAPWPCVSPDFRASLPRRRSRPGSSPATAAAGCLLLRRGRRPPLPHLL